MSGADHYEVLNVERTASTAEIKSAYRKLVRQVHPDQGGNAALFRLVQEAWTTLSDPAKRAAYDRNLDRPSAPEPPHHEPAPEPEPEWTWSTDQPWAEGPPEPPRTGDWSEHPRTGNWSEQPWSGEATGARLTAPPGPVLISPIFGRWRLPALIALALWTAVLVTVLVTTEVHSAWDALVYVGLAGMLVLALPSHWTRRIPLRRPFQTVGVATAVLYLLMLLPFTKADLTTLDRILLVGLVGDVVIVRFLTGRWSKYHALDKAIDRDAAFEFNLWGRPGEPLVSSAPAPPITEYDALLQRRTANLLDPVVAALPAAKLVHGAQLGGVVVDHLLLNGRRAALISSLVGPPGTYSLDAYGELQVNGHPLPSRVSALATTVAAWSGRLRHVDVRGFLIVHPDQGAVTTQPGPGASVTILPAPTAAQDLHTWLRPEGNEVDRTALYDILHRAPHGLR